MRITWDRKAKAVYVYLTGDTETDHTTQIGERVYLDYLKGKPVGIEILNVEDTPVIERISK